MLKVENRLNFSSPNPKANNNKNRLNFGKIVFDKNALNSDPVRKDEFLKGLKEIGSFTPSDGKYFDLLHLGPCNTEEYTSQESSEDKQKEADQKGLDLAKNLKFVVEKEVMIIPDN